MRFPAGLRDERNEMGQYVVEKVTLNDEEECGGYIKSMDGEWRVVDRITGEVLMTFPWSESDDHTEWPDRHFESGPISVTVDEEEMTVTCHYTMEGTVGFKFEETEGAFSKKVFKLPRR